MAVVEKKSKAIRRHRRVAIQYSKWLQQNPKAGRRERIQKLDQISDIEYISDSKLGQ